MSFYFCDSCEEIKSKKDDPMAEFKGRFVCPDCFDELDAEENIAMRDWHLVGDCDAENWRPGE